MRISIALLFAVVLQLSAENGYAQRTRIAISMSNVSVEQVLNKIEETSDYVFLYNDKTIQTNRIVSVKNTSGNIMDILAGIFKGTDVTYAVVDKQIILSTKKQDTAQQNPTFQLKGTVKDSKGEPLIGVNVKVKGNTVGAITDLDGNFALQVSKGDILEISYVGYASKDVKVADNRELAIILEEDTKVLNEVVVTALGIKKEAKSLSYNVQQVSGSDIVKVPETNFINSLNGKVAGVTINSSASGIGSASRVVMRGMKSINGNNNALYVIDGIPMNNVSSGNVKDIYEGRGQTGDAISNLNPDDIESISVLSGPSAAALYGSAAANGVILVTTKSGKSGKVSVSISNTTSFSSPLLLPDLQTTYGLSEEGSYFSWGDKLTTPSAYDVKDFFQTGVNVTNSVSLSTGTEKNQTYLSLGTVNANGIIHNNNYDRYNASVRNTSKLLNDKMTLDLSFMVSKVKEQNMLSQGQYFNPLIPLYLFPAGDDFSKVQAWKREDASRNLQVQYWPYGAQSMSMQNPYWITERNLFINHKDRYMGSASLKYELFDWLNVSGRVKIDRNTARKEQKFYASTIDIFGGKNGFYSLGQQENQQIYGEFIANINKYFGDNRFSLTANFGANFETVSDDYNKYEGKLKAVANLFTFKGIDPSTQFVDQYGGERKKRAVFGSAQLGYKSMVYLDVTGRNDWSSTFKGTNTKSVFYPTIGLSGILTDIFHCSTDVMPYLKARISYSEVGNDPDPYLGDPTYSLTNGYPATQKRMPNPDLKPERTKSWEVGLNFVFFKNKLKLDATYYKSSTYNQFFDLPLPASSGYTNVIVNGGRVDNKGVELSLRYDDTFGDFGWNSYLTYSLNRNEVVELLRGWKNPKNGEIYSITEQDLGGATDMYKMRAVEGRPLGDIYVTTLRTDEHGAIYVDSNEKTVVAEPNKWVYAGNSSPKYNLSWGNTLTWKGIALNFLLSARVGGIVVSQTQAVLDAFGASQATADARDAGGALVNGKRIPAQQYYATVGGGAKGGVGSVYVYSATNARLAELNVSYDLPVQKWCNWIKGLNVGFTGKNLFLLYKKAPFDPELTASTGSYFQGIDYFMMPSLRNLGFSVKVRF